jgi:hypothetical protein
MAALIYHENGTIRGVAFRPDPTFDAFDVLEVEEEIGVEFITGARDVSNWRVDIGSDGVVALMPDLKLSSVAYRGLRKVEEGFDDEEPGLHLYCGPDGTLAFLRRSGGGRYDRNLPELVFAICQHGDPDSPHMIFTVPADFTDTYTVVVGRETIDAILDGEFDIYTTILYVRTLLIR